MLAEELFPPGTPVRVRETIHRRGTPITTEVVGVVEHWEDKPTGSWYAHGKRHKLWLKRLTLRKVDGELTTLVVNGATSIAKLEPAGGEGGSRKS